ncbi:hypothetical protein LX32DRAFT_79723 [Colletotrichum zoysiae]|uniref:Uncharacterized protein n=1 Tax=Colletotrichum zoysiae TaxID=1216348 RepID=A0AAD9HA41_9PEZI|nr:hypothetical protein LX32DRAFT_79723 [Colletotrichum zoysiae]
MALDVRILFWVCLLACLRVRLVPTKKMMSTEANFNNTTGACPHPTRAGPEKVSRSGRTTIDTTPPRLGSRANGSAHDAVQHELSFFTESGWWHCLDHRPNYRDQQNTWQAWLRKVEDGVYLSTIDDMLISLIRRFREGTKSTLVNI